MIWPLVPNWAKGVKETLVFKTEVITSRSGKEQRRALRTTPRRNLVFQVLADNGRRQAFESAMSTNLDGAFLMPDFLRGVRSTSALPVSGSSITVRSVPAWLVPGAKVALASQRKLQAFEVDSVVGLTVTFVESAEEAARTSSLLSPLVEGWTSESLKANLITRSITTADVDFDVAPGTESVEQGEINFDWWFNGREILSLRPNWLRAPNITFSNNAETVDYGRGRVVKTTPVPFVTRVQQASYLRRTGEEIAFLRQFFMRMKGQRGDFYMTTGTSDLVLETAIVSGTNATTIAGPDAYDRYKDDPVYRAILIRHVNGWQFSRSITEIALVGGNSVFTMASDWVFDLPPDEVVSISWMPLHRFASDTLVLDWATDQVAQSTLAIRTLEHTDPDPTEGLDALSQYMLSTYGQTFTENVLCDPLQWAVNVRYPEIAGI